MSHRKFKAGDKVYFPALGGNIVELRENESGFAAYALIAERCGRYRSVNTLGREWSADAVPSIFHATPENHELLERLYGIDFEKPPAKPTPKEIIEAMLKRGDELVPCMVADYESDWSFALVKRVGEQGGYIDGVGNHWDCAKPIDPRTITEITELPHD